ncbi:hypothetical protein LX32DRAFT_584069 [Colletotrichum zoysiae]|uniref:Uncharacterized protein n=1 Tax=Colletotrichum zoysiae TaxID=1216348 RepID=A0AAD9HP66_9PEZI|nr:hypothetical protein LX32DRAFT_584069 [Colletotrichum zoysiae]
MSSLGLPGPSNTPPGDVALHRSWNRFLDGHRYLRLVFQTTPARIDEQCADAVAALRAPAERRAREGAAVLRLWDRVGLAVDALPPDANPPWRAEEQLLKPTALRLAARRARLAEERRERERLRAARWPPTSFTLDMPVQPPSGSETPRWDKGKGRDEGKDERRGTATTTTTTTTPLQVATSLANTEYFLGHRPGDPVFSYDPRPALAPADERNFTYRGRVPRAPGVDLLRLQLLLPRVLAQLVVLLAFSPDDGPTPGGLVPAECVGMLGEVDDLGDGVFLEIRRRWRAKFGAMTAGEAAPYMHFLRSGPLVRELAWLVCALCLDDAGRGPRGEEGGPPPPRARRLWATVLPVVEVLTSDRDEGASARDALLRIARLHVRDQGRLARDAVFGEGDYGRALVYRQGVLVNKSIHSFYASYADLLRPAALSRTDPHPIPAAEPDPDNDDDDLDVFDTDPVPIPDEVLAAYLSISARHEIPPELNDLDGHAPPPQPPEPPSRSETTIVVAADRRRRRPEDKGHARAAAAAQEPPRKRARR